MGKTPHNIMGVVFDLDDTLARVAVDWEKMRFKIRKLYFQYGVNREFRPVLQHIDEATEFLVEKMGELKALELKSKALEIIEKIAVEGAELASPIDGAQELLLLIKELDLKIGILSRNTRNAVITTIRRCNFLPFVDVVMAREDCSKYKPDPLPVEEMARKLGIAPKNLVTIGDHPYDIISGKEAGTITIGVLLGNPSRSDLVSAGADFIVASLGDLKNLLSNIVRG